MNSSTSLPVAQSPRQRGFSSRSLFKAIFDSERPEEFARSLPAQSLYLAVRHAGLSSAADILLLTSVEQSRLLLDLDCWNKDSFNEEHFWEWLALGDDEEGLLLLQRLIQSIDLKLIGLLISRHVEVVTVDESTDAPPGPGYYTPDQGHTWIFLKFEDESKHFLFGRLLAMLFETNADLFYQLLATPGVATSSMLEEDSYTERNKRLASEGIPEPALALETHAPLSPSEIRVLLDGAPKSVSLRDIATVQPLVYDSATPQPLARILEDPRFRDNLEAEVTFIMNAALVHFHIDISNMVAVQQLAERVKGAINLGMQSAEKHCSRSAEEMVKHVGLRPLYQHGHFLLSELRTCARKVTHARTDHTSEELKEALLAVGARFPYVPQFLRVRLSTVEQASTSSKESPSPTSLDTSPEAIFSLALFESLRSWTTDQAADSAHSAS